MFAVRGSGGAAQQNETVDEKAAAALALSFQPGMSSRVSGQNFHENNTTMRQDVWHDVRVTPCVVL